MPRQLIRALLATALAAALAACAAPPTGQDPAPAWLLVSDYGDGVVQVLTTEDDLDDLARETPLAIAGSGPCGVAVGPGNRLYVADYDGGEIVVFGLATALGGGAPTPVATLTSPSLSGPCGLAFDADGTLWVGDYSNAHVLGFRGVGTLTGTQDLVADAVLTVGGGGGVLPWVEVIEILIDGAGRLWVADLFEWTITRIDDVRTLEGDHTGRVPNAQIVYTDAGAPPVGGDYTIADPFSVAVDAAGNLYVGNDFEGYVSRFDGAAGLNGVVTPQPSAYLVAAGIDFPYLVALDADGALWVGNEDTVARLLSPQSGSGVRELTPTTTVTYSLGGFNDGGGMTFVPTPPGLGF
ncbi:MAG: hypothetical protein R6W77_13315 [Trueperaceae bacterium]